MSAGERARVWSVSRKLSWRGAGLGNELIPAAKAWLAARVTGARLVPHSWGLNPRGYGRLFGASRWDAVPPALAIAASHSREISIEAWRRHRLEDYGLLAGAVFAETGWRRGPRCLVSSGMWGGYAAVDAAKPWVRNLLSSAAGAAAALAEFERSTCGHALRIGIHVRRGDFAEMSADLRGRFNVRLPMTWYRGAVRSLAAQLGAGAVFCLFGDGELGEQDDILAPARSTWRASRHGHATADLLALSSCDLIVCSVSSYSLLAAWLGEVPYLWPREQMLPLHGRLTLWGAEADQGNWMMADALRAEAAVLPSPCVPVGLDGACPADEIARVLAGDWSRERRCDPIRYGAVGA